jgi:hypothetical protein
MNKGIWGGSGILGLALAVFCGGAHGMSPGTHNAGEHKTVAAGFDIVGQLPVGNFADAVGFGIGALGRFERQLGMSPAVFLTARAGYIGHTDKENGGVTTGYSQIPLLAGFKYSLTGAPIYVGAEAGAVVSMTDVDGPGTAGDGSTTETNLGVSAGAGYELGPVDIRLSLNFPDATNLGDMMTVGVSFGYNFWGM